MNYWQKHGEDSRDDRLVEINKEYFKGWRLSLGFSRKEAAEALGCSEKSVEFYEYSGRRVPESKQKLMKFISDYHRRAGK